MELLINPTFTQTNRQKAPFVVWLNDNDIHRMLVQLTFKKNPNKFSNNYTIAYFNNTDDAIKFTLENFNDIFLFIQDSYRKDSKIISDWRIKYKNKLSLTGVAGDFYYYIIDAFVPEAGSIFSGCGFGNDEALLINEWGKLDSRIAFFCNPYKLPFEIFDKYFYRWLNNHSSASISKEVLKSKDITDELIVLCNINPSSLDNISPRKFEKLIASIFRNHGFHVELTSFTRDGGYDIIAAENTSIKSEPILIEVKHFAPKRPVGVGIVRALYGTMHINSASKAILATSSYVTKDAKREFARVIPWELEFIEREKIIDMCKSCIPSILDKRLSEK